MGVSHGRPSLKPRRSRSVPSPRMTLPGRSPPPELTDVFGRPDRAGAPPFRLTPKQSSPVIFRRRLRRGGARRRQGSAMALSELGSSGCLASLAHERCRRRDAVWASSLSDIRHRFISNRCLPRCLSSFSRQPGRARASAPASGGALVVGGVTTLKRGRTAAAPAGSPERGCPVWIAI